MRHLEGRLAADADFLDAGALHRLDPQFGVAQLERRANLGGRAQLVEDVAAEGVVVIRHDVEFEEPIDAVRADAAFGATSIGRSGLYVVLLGSAAPQPPRP